MHGRIARSQRIGESLFCAPKSTGLYCHSAVRTAGHKDGDAVVSTCAWGVKDHLVQVRISRVRALNFGWVWELHVKIINLAMGPIL